MWGCSFSYSVFSGKWCGTSCQSISAIRICPRDARCRIRRHRPMILTAPIAAHPFRRTAFTAISAERNSNKNIYPASPAFLPAVRQTLLPIVRRVPAYPLRYRQLATRPYQSAHAIRRAFSFCPLSMSVLPRSRHSSVRNSKRGKPLTTRARCVILFL